MSLTERISAVIETIEGQGDVVGRLVVGADAQNAEGIYATSISVGGRTVDIHFSSDSGAFGLERIKTTVERI